MRDFRTEKRGPGRLALKLMGRFEVCWGSSAPVALPGTRARALLAYLALPLGRAQPRDKLTGLFWPDADESRGRQRLRQAVLELRKRLGGAPCLRAAGPASAR
jgi:DNA-binding SARP family transcriptional activator